MTFATLIGGPLDGAIVRATGKTLPDWVYVSTNPKGTPRGLPIDWSPHPTERFPVEYQAAANLGRMYHVGNVLNRKGTGA